MSSETSQQLTVTKRIEDRGDVVRLILARSDGQAVLPFEAGAHLDIYIPTLNQWRQYSISSDPADTSHYEVGILKDPASRGGSVALQELALVGVTFTVEGPRNLFPLVEDAQQTLLFGAGIGITPMLAMARRLQAMNKPFTLHYSAKSSDRAAFLDRVFEPELAEHVVLHLSDSTEYPRLDITQVMAAAESGCHLYACGPDSFMEALLGKAKELGFPAGQLHREYFSADVELSGDEFEVECAQSNIIVRVGSNDTIVKALASVGINIEVKCEEGVCGTCMTEVLEGEIDHRDEFLTDDEREDGDVICACCSRCKGPRLVLDI